MCSAMRTYTEAPFGPFVLIFFAVVSLPSSLVHLCTPVCVFVCVLSCGSSVLIA